MMVTVRQPRASFSTLWARPWALLIAILLIAGFGSLGPGWCLDCQVETGGPEYPFEPSGTLAHDLAGRLPRPRSSGESPLPNRWKCLGAVDPPSTLKTHQVRPGHSFPRDVSAPLLC